jgi:hypothetical protein
MPLKLLVLGQDARGAAEQARGRLTSGAQQGVQDDVGLDVAEHPAEHPAGHPAGDGTEEIGTGLLSMETNDASSGSRRSSDQAGAP